MLSPVTNAMDWLPNAGSQSAQAPTGETPVDFAALLAPIEVEGGSIPAAEFSLPGTEKATDTLVLELAAEIMPASPHSKSRARRANDDQSDEIRIKSEDVKSPDVVVPVDVASLVDPLLPLIVNVTNEPSSTQTAKAADSDPILATDGARENSTGTVDPAAQMLREEGEKTVVSHTEKQTDKVLNALQEKPGALRDYSATSMPPQGDSQEWTAPQTDSATRRVWVADVTEPTRDQLASARAIKRDTVDKASQVPSPSESDSVTAIEPTRIAVSKTTDVTFVPDTLSRNAAAKAIAAFVAPAVQQNAPGLDQPVVEAAAPVLESAPAEATLTDQIVRSIRLQALLGGGEAELQLDPKYLGAVRISLRVVDGSISAAIQAEQPAVREWIEGHQSQLRDAVAEHGLELTSLDVKKPSESQTSRDRTRDEAEGREQEPQRRRRRPSHDTPEFELTA